HRRERHRALQLRVISPAASLVGGGPAPIEDIFAVRMALEIERHGADEAPAVVLESEMLRLPPGLARRRAARLERIEERVTEERIVVAGAGVPFGRRYVGEPRDDVAGEDIDADRGARVAPGIAEQLHNEIGRAVRDLRLLREILDRVDEGAEAHAPQNAVEIAAQRIFHDGEDVEGA